MKKLLLFLIPFFLISSCSKSPSEKICSDAEKFLTQNFQPKLKDPTSYEIISTSIVDTVMLSDEMKDDIELFHSLEYIESKSFDIDTIQWKPKIDSVKLLNEIKERDSLLNVASNVPKDKIGYITIEHKYKALNGMGLNAPGKLIIYYRESGFGCPEIACDDKFFIYSSK